MARPVCPTCEVLKEIYWLKASRFVLAARRGDRIGAGHPANDEEIQALQDEAMESLRTLLYHVNSSHGFSLDNAARTARGIGAPPSPICLVCESVKAGYLRSLFFICNPDP